MLIIAQLTSLKEKIIKAKIFPKMDLLGESMEILSALLAKRIIEQKEVGKNFTRVVLRKPNPLPLVSKDPQGLALSHEGRS